MLQTPSSHRPCNTTQSLPQSFHIKHTSPHKRNMTITSSRMSNVQIRLENKNRTDDRFWVSISWFSGAQFVMFCLSISDQHEVTDRQGMNDRTEDNEFWPYHSSCFSGQPGDSQYIGQRLCSSTDFYSYYFPSKSASRTLPEVTGPLLPHFSQELTATIVERWEEGRGEFPQPSSSQI